VKSAGRIWIVRRSFPKRLLRALPLLLMSAALLVEGFAHPHGTAAVLWALGAFVGWAAILATILGQSLLSKLHARRHPELQSYEPNYDRTPYV
jgi:hypothetical protein